PARAFSGRVKQVRLQSKTQDNVVNYTTVIAVENPDGSLLPGMTATVSFVTGAATNVLMVPNAALRFRPVDAAITKPAGGQATGARVGRTRHDSTAATQVAARGSLTSGGASGAPPARAPGGTLWRVGPDGKLVGTRVATGISDGQRTVILGDKLPAGTEVVIGMTVPGAAVTTPAAGTTNPLQPQRTQGGGRRAGPV
ncbi:MAG: hypothetical protein ABI647_17095, partial [Gemmatimonadota bacterium]